MEALGARNIAFLLGAGCSSMVVGDGTERGIATMAPLAKEFCGAAGGVAGVQTWAFNASDLSCLAGHGLTLAGEYTRNLERLMETLARAPLRAWRVATTQATLKRSRRSRA